MSLLYWQLISAGHWVSGPFTIRRSRYARQWIVSERGRDIGFRPTLSLAKRLAERNTPAGRRAA